MNEGGRQANEEAWRREVLSLLRAMLAQLRKMNGEQV